jgi:hypothetical protein
MPADTRRAPARWSFEDADGHSSQGEGEAAIDDAGIGVGPVRVAFLDADSLAAAGHAIELGLWPAGRLTISGLGRRFETFAAELRKARNRARVAGLLAHAPSPPETFEGDVLTAGPASPVEAQVYSSHVTFVTGDSDPWQLPLGALQQIESRDDPPAVALVTASGSTVVGGLGRRRDAFLRAVTEARDAQARTLADYTGRPGFADGLGRPGSRVTGFDYLLERCSSAERHAGARRIVALASGGEPRIGFVELLDPDGDSLRARAELPKPWASFLLVPIGDRVVFELLAGPTAATYLFEGEIESVNRDLQQLHFRRAALALTAAEAELTPDNPHRLALRRLAPLQRLRATTRGRIVHAENWGAALEQALAERGPGGVLMADRQPVALEGK